MLENLRDYRLIETAGLPPPQLLPAFPYFNRRGQQLLSIGWVQISTSDSLSCLLVLSEGSDGRSLSVSAP